MKYISRLTALLLALMMIITSSVAETISNTGLTRDMLDALYEEADGKEKHVEPGVLGDTVTLEAFNTLIYKDFIWYDANGNVISQGSNTLDVTYTMEEQRFVCHSTGNILGIWEHDRVFIVAPAQTSDMNPYLDYLYNHNTQWTSQEAVFSFMMNNWNVDFTDESGATANLARMVIAAWDATKIGLPEDLFCTCVAVGGLNHRDCLLPPDGGHLQSCPWFNNVIMPPLPEQPPLFDGAPDGEQYIATETVALSDTANRAVILPEGGRAVLTYSGLQAQSRGGSGNNWQIFTGDEWVDIQGDSDPSIVITEAKINSITQLTGIAQLRYLDKDNSVVLASASVTTKEIAGGSYPAAEASAVSLTAQNRAAADGVCDISITYELEDGTQLANPYTASVTLNDGFRPTVEVYRVTGYTFSKVIDLSTGQELQEDSFVSLVKGGDPERVTGIKFNYTTLAKDISLKVVYEPAMVNFLVEHYMQKLDGGYDAVTTKTVQALTGSEIGGGMKPDNPGHWNNEDKLYLTAAEANTLGYDLAGFRRVAFDGSDTVAADGSTVLEIYYDRYYYLVGIDMDGGYGSEPVYAMYGAPVSVTAPQKAGYTFDGWYEGTASTDADGNVTVTYDTSKTVDIPATMGVGNTYYKAKWDMNETAKVTFVFWGENANDEGYTPLGNAIEVQNQPTNVDISYLTCTQEAHVHTAECLYCIHQHDASCYSAGGRSLLETTVPTQLADVTTDGIHTYNYNRSTRYYLRLNGKWYCGQDRWGNESNTTTITLNCDHTHTAECYSCGKTEHTHGSGCILNIGYTYDATKWVLVRSEKETVAPDGSTVIDVYFDRVEYTITFVDSSTTIYELTRKWGADIKDFWPVGKNYPTSNNEVYDGGQRWDPSGTSLYTEVLVFLEIMPADSFTLTCDEKNYDTFIMHYMAEALPGASGTSSYTYNNVTKQFSKRFDEVSANYNHVTEKEDFFNLNGFTQWTSNPRFSGGSLDISGGGDVYFYYTRNSYQLVFNNQWENVKTETVQFEAPLTPYASYIPECPTELYPAGSHYFDGWYLNPQCSGDEYKLSDHTMPVGAADGDVSLRLYAKWSPNVYNVKFFRTADDRLLFNAGLAQYPNDYNPLTDEVTFVDTKGNTQTLVLGYDPRLPYTVNEDGTITNPQGMQTVTYNTTATKVPFPKSMLEPVGWFYMDGNVEKAFDFSMPITKDMDLYVKWTSSTLIEYSIRYALDNDGDGKPDVGTDGEVIYIADHTTGWMLADSQQTFEAKGDTALYADYQTGIFPRVRSHGFNPEIWEDGWVYPPNPAANSNPKNEWFDTNGDDKIDGGTPNASGLRDAQGYTFLYKKAGPVPYEVHYVTEELVAGAETIERDGVTYYVVASSKLVKDNWKSIVTERYAAVPGYMPDEFMKSLVITYNADTQNVAKENVILFIYTQDEKNGMYSVTHWVEDGEETVNGETKWRKYNEYGEILAVGTEVKEVPALAALTNTGVYYFDETVKGTLRTGTIEAGKELQLNLYYREVLVPIHYVPVGPDGVGAQTKAGGVELTTEDGTPVPGHLADEKVKAVTGVPVGAKAGAKYPQYKFVGWYLDAACTQPVNSTWVSAATITPQENGNVSLWDIDSQSFKTTPVFKETTYYAKFDYNAGMLKLEKSGLRPGESAIFEVLATPIDTGEEEKFVIVLTGDSAGRASATISNLMAGSPYKVTEDAHWTWSYDTVQMTNGSGEINGGNIPVVVTIVNQPKKDQWLHGETSCVNAFNPTSTSTETPTEPQNENE